MIILETSAPGSHCVGTKLDGTPCLTTIGLSPAGLCIQHDPLRQEVQALAIENSVATRAAKRAQRLEILPEGMPATPPKTFADAARYAAWAMHSAVTGAIDARTAECVAKLVTAFLAAVKQRDLEAELTSLRDQVLALKKGRAA